jgi:DNA-binding transcriptional LysR family regulator
MTTYSKDFTIDPRRLRVLREVGLRGTVTSAASGLHLTPSAVSQQIAALSRELGVPLLEKTGRGVRLTGQAQLVLTHASVVQAQFELARADLAAFADGRIGTVSLAGFATSISGLIAPAIRELRSSRPSISLTAVEMEPPDIFTALDRGDVDIAVAVDYRKVPPRSDPHYFRVDLLPDLFDVALPLGHPMANREGIDLLDLASEVFVAASPGSSCSEVTLAACAAAGFSPDVRHYSSDWNAVAALVGAGLGVGLVPRLAQPLHAVGVVVRPVVGPRAARNIFAAVRAGAQTDPVIRAALDVLRAVGVRVAASDRASSQAVAEGAGRAAAGALAGDPVHA